MSSPTKPMDGRSHILNDTSYTEPTTDRENRDRGDDPKQQQICLNGRPIGLRRQPTKYPHGLGISVQTIANNSNNKNNNNNFNKNNDNNEHTNHNYNRSPTLHCNWDDETMKTANGRPTPEGVNNFAELHERRLKFPHTTTNNHYMADPQQQQHQQQQQTSSTSTSAPMIKSPFVFFEKYAKRFARWKYLRWPLIFIASALLFFGLISYCIWLHDVSVAREKYLQDAQRLRVFNQTADDVVTTSSEETVDDYHNPETTTTASVEPYFEDAHESTKLKAIRTIAYTSKQPKEQKLSTFEYDRSVKSKAATKAWDKVQKTYSKTTDSALVTTTEAMTTLTAAEAAVVPKNTYHFTSGHQNSFGVPIEEDERVLRLINGLYPVREPPTSTTRWTKVSPTIPPVSRLDPTKPLPSNSRTSPLPLLENGCYSTSLAMCQGVLDYDLTYNSTVTLDFTQTEAYESLVHSNCSARAVEFICSALEPECRPSHIGVLPPCRRICKAILEACSVVIANSDTLSSLFDCNLYPDSNDAQKCEDPTRRRNFCHDNEFQCYDRSCIPNQWQCDNIKDCDAGEDEDGCLVCDQPDEFRCRSNEKCVPDATRCDSKYDCFDGSDEEDCDDYGYGSGDSDGVGGAFDEALNSFPRIFSYASFLSPNQSSDKLYTYITATADDDDGSGTKFQVHEITNRTSGISNEEVTNSVPGDGGGPKGFVNFRDSKEIMMTSDTENNFKYSTATRKATTTNRNSSTGGTSKMLASTTPLQPEASNRVAVTTELPVALKSKVAATASTATAKPMANCAAHQLRCVSGKCITVAQLCDKKIDCPDGADELMCVYKERLGSAKSSTFITTTTTTTTGKPTTTTAKPTTTTRATTSSSRSPASTTLRPEKQRTVRTTTIRRKVKN